MKKRMKKMKNKRHSNKHKGQFKPWHPGQFVALELIEEVFESGGAKARSIARNAQFEADTFLVNMMINQVCGERRKTLR